MSNANRELGGRWLLVRALISFLVLPGVAAFLVPPLLIRGDARRGDGWTFGAAVMALGAALLLWCVRDFYASGRGTLAPWDPPRRLVIVGLYRFVRNPMYVSVLTLVVGWALVAASPNVAIYAALLAVGFHLRVITYEEPWLARTFGDDWARYSAQVRRWIPQTKPQV